MYKGNDKYIVKYVKFCTLMGHKYCIIEFKTFGLVLEFEMWRCGINGKLTKSTKVWIEVTGLISCSSKVIAQI